MVATVEFSVLDVFELCMFARLSISDSIKQHRKYYLAHIGNCAVTDVDISKRKVVA